MWWLLFSCVGEGTAIQIPGGEISLETHSVSMGPVGFDDTLQTSVVLGNSGSASLSLALSQTGSLEFEVSLEDAVVPAGGNTRILITYTPVDPDGAQGTVSLVGQDQVADGEIELLGSVEFDADGDGYTHELAGGTDCDDQDEDIHPGSQELWYDGTDQDCDGSDDDQDEDGYGVEVDCDDLDGGVHPGEPDMAGGGDQDCDGLVDEDAIEPGATVLSEVFVASSWNSSGLEQWIEIHNDSAWELDLVGWEIASLAGSGWVLDSAPVQAGELAVLCATDDKSDNGALSCTGVVDPWPTLGAGADIVKVLVADVVVDQVSWDEDWGLQVGASHQLDPGHLDADENDQVEVWCPGTQVWTHDDAGSPGGENEACPATTEADTGSQDTGPR